MTDFAVVTTGGGDNVVIAQQTARYLLKIIQLAKGGKADKLQSNSSVTYIKEYAKVGFRPHISDSRHLQTWQQLLDVTWLRHAFTDVALHHITLASEKMASSIGNGLNIQEAWNENMMALIEAAEAHCNVYQVDSFLSVISVTNDSSLKQMLTQLFYLFAIRLIEEKISSFISASVVAQKQVELISQAVLQLCKQLRKHAVLLMDSFGIPDSFLRTPLGRYDGNIYEHYFQVSKNNRVNSQVAPYFENLILPRTKNQPQSRNKKN